MILDGEPQTPDEELSGELRRAQASHRRLPDFFVVGHAKCGTTALYRMLRAHPQIYMPELKEPHFFARAPHERAQPSKRRPNTLEQYLALFEAAAPEQLAGEASTTYLRSSAAAGRIAEMRPDARIIAILREPAGFLRSFHLQMLQSGIESEPDLATAMGLEEQRRSASAGEPAALWQQALLYSEHVRYVEQLRRYHERFGRERVLALIYDDFRGDNERVAREVLRFLDVEDSLELERFLDANPSVYVRSSRAGELVRAVSVGRGPVSRRAKAAVKSVAPRRLRREAVQTLTRKFRSRQPPPPDEAFMGELRRRFKGEVAAASEYLERDLVGLWGYDDVQ